MLKMEEEYKLKIAQVEKLGEREIKKNINQI